jgi:polyisoprenoid-binding protein YceI
MRALALMLMAALAAPAAAQPVTYVLDPEASFVHFELLHFGTSTIRGRLGPVQGQVQVDRQARRGEVNVRVPTASIDTGLAVFNARIREPDLLASAAFPEAYFVATQLRWDGERLAEVRGEFTLRGIGQAVSLRALHFACRSDGSGATATEVCGGDFEAEVLRSEFGATFGLPFVGDRVRLQIQVEGRRR